MTHSNGSFELFAESCFRTIARSVEIRYRASSYAPKEILQGLSMIQQSGAALLQMEQTSRHTLYLCHRSIDSELFGSGVTDSGSAKGDLIAPWKDPKMSVCANDIHSMSALFSFSSLSKLLTIFLLYSLLKTVHYFRTEPREYCTFTI